MFKGFKNRENVSGTKGRRFESSQACKTFYKMIFANLPSALKRQKIPVGLIFHDK